MYSIFVIEHIDHTIPGFFIGYTLQKSLRKVFHRNAHKVSYPKNDLHIRCIAEHLSLETAKERIAYHHSSLMENDRMIHARKDYDKRSEYRKAHREQLNMARRVETAWRFFIRQLEN